MIILLTYFYTEKEIVALRLLWTIHHCYFWYTLYCNYYFSCIHCWISKVMGVKLLFPFVFQSLLHNCLFMMTKQISLSICLKLYSVHYSHFILKWFQPISFQEVCFSGESYENMQKIKSLKILRTPSIRHQGLCLLSEVKYISKSFMVISLFASEELCHNPPLPGLLDHALRGGALRYKSNVQVPTEGRK